MYRPEFENGGLYSETLPGFTTLFGISQVTKLTVASGFQPLALSEPLAQASGATGGALSGSQPGEIFVGFQAVVLPGRGTNLPKASVTFAVSTRVPAPELDIGTFRNSALILVSDNLAGFHFDVNGVFFGTD